MNILTKLCKWYVDKQVAKTKKATAQVQDEQLVKAYHNLNSLYEFCKFLNKSAFKNRHERKQFWADVADGRPVVTDMLNRMLIAYGVKSETIKKLEDERKKKFIEETKAEQK